MSKNPLPALALFALIFVAPTCAGDVAGPATQPAEKVGEQIPSEDPIIKDFHCLGLIDGRTDIFRSACPVRDLAKQAAQAASVSSALRHEARDRMQHLHDLGIRTDICFQDLYGDAGEPGKADELGYSIDIEKQAAHDAGIEFVYRPMRNAGPNSLQTMSDQEVFDWTSTTARQIVADAKVGGVFFHCSAGHDRTGLVAAFMRMKYQHWPVDQAIAEMRRLGHNWPKFSSNSGESSWHEDHLRAMAKMLPADADSSK